MTMIPHTSSIKASVVPADYAVPAPDLGPLRVWVVLALAITLVIGIIIGFAFSWVNYQNSLDQIEDRFDRQVIEIRQQYETLGENA